MEKQSIEKKDISYVNDSKDSVDNMGEVKEEEPNSIVAEKETGVVKRDPKPGNIKLL